MTLTSHEIWLHLSLRDTMQTLDWACGPHSPAKKDCPIFAFVVIVTKFLQKKSDKLSKFLGPNSQAGEGSVILNCGSIGNKYAKSGSVGQ